MLYLKLRIVSGLKYAKAYPDIRNLDKGQLVERESDFMIANMDGDKMPEDVSEWYFEKMYGTNNHENDTNVVSTQE